MRDNAQLAGAQPQVYPYHEESRHIIAFALERGIPFERIVGCFGGAGHAEIKALLHLGGAAPRMTSSLELNPRGIPLSQANFLINTPPSEEGRINFERGDIRDRLLAELGSKGRTLFLGNAPFALKVEGQNDYEIMRDGGMNGLQLTLAFVRRAYSVAERGDHIIGVAYSRLNDEGGALRLELQEEFDRIIGLPGFATIEIELVEGEKLYRSHRKLGSEKQQDNPMPVEKIVVKADPDDRTSFEAHQRAAELHRKQGWNKIGYYRYVIRIDASRSERQSCFRLTRNVQVYRKPAYYFDRHDYQGLAAVA